MFRNLIVSGATLGLALASSAALADRDHHDKGWKRGNDTDYARVVAVDPIVRQVRVSVPRQECWDEARYERDRPAPKAGSMILGGLIGGVIGSQVGRGDGRRAATVAGAVIGSAIGHDAAERRAGRDTGGGYRNYERCETYYDERSEERIDGYEVTYEYAGREYFTRLPYDPGERLRVRVDVTPVGR